MASYDDFQSYMLGLMRELSASQEETVPELFEPVADAFLQYVKEERKLFFILYNKRQQRREAKYRMRLQRKGWRKRIKDAYKAGVNEEESSDSSAGADKSDSGLCDSVESNAVGDKTIEKPANEEQSSPLAGLTSQEEDKSTENNEELGDEQKPVVESPPGLAEESPQPELCGKQQEVEEEKVEKEELKGAFEEF